MEGTLLEKVIKLDENDELNMVRILILINQISGKDMKNSIDGINKLVKLDFLLRYPVALERILFKLNKEKDAGKLNIEKYERESVEANLMYFNYGPWDSRYRKFFSILESKNLIMYSISGKTIRLSITHRGRNFVNDISGYLEFESYIFRSELIKKYVASLSPKKLVNFFYEVFPEMITMQSGEKIQI